MKKIFYLTILALFVLGCSDGDQIVIPVPQQTDSAYEPFFNVNLNGTPVSLDDSDEYNSGAVVVEDDIIYVHGGIAVYDAAESTETFELYIDRNGNFISAMVYSRNQLGIYYFRSFNNFPSHYMNVELLELDEVNHRIRLKFNGPLYMYTHVPISVPTIEVSLDAVYFNFSGELDLIYTGDFADPKPFLYTGAPIYCTADFNGIPWRARQRKPTGEFIATDPYKMYIYFKQGTAVGSYPFTNSSTDAYIKFYKWNTATLQYDEYTTSGTMAYTYKEAHGMNRFSYIGTCDFTAVNPNNATDVIHVTSGSFRTYLQY